MPAERAYAHHATELLLRSDRFDEVAELIASTLVIDEADAVGYRLLSAAEMLRGQPDLRWKRSSAPWHLPPMPQSTICIAATYCIASPALTRRPTPSAALPHSIQRTRRRNVRS
jgi:hypothetical protein